VVLASPSLSVAADAGDASLSGEPFEASITIEDTPSDPYDRLAQVFSRVYAETRSVAIALEVLDTFRAREAVARPSVDLSEQVLMVATSVCHVPVSRLLRPGRHRDICCARWIASWLFHRRRWTTVKIGRYLGLDHSTVLHGLRRVAGCRHLLLLARSAEAILESASSSWTQSE
jgi:hypothetical protein